MADRFYDPMHGPNLLFYYAMALIGKLAVESRLGSKLVALMRKVWPAYNASGDASTPTTCQPQTTKKFFYTKFDAEVMELFLDCGTNVSIRLDEEATINTDMHVAELVHDLLGAVRSFYEFLYDEPQLASREVLWGARQFYLACFKLYDMQVHSALHFMTNHFLEDIQRYPTDAKAAAEMQKLMTEGLEGSHPHSRRMAKLAYKSPSYGFKIEWTEIFLRETHILLACYNNRVGAHSIRELIMKQI